MSNRSKTLYVGYTDNLKRRVLEHKNKTIDGFTKKYNITKLVYYEKFDNPLEAETREHQLKNWHREWKIILIESKNKDWKDIFNDFMKQEIENISILFK